MFTIWWLTYLARAGLSPAGIIDLARPHTPWFSFITAMIYFFLNTYLIQEQVVLAEEDISFIKMHLSEWLVEQSLTRSASTYDIDLHERMVRMEEALKTQGKELKAQREIIQLFMQQVDKRFEQMQSNMDRRFEQIDKRFEQMQSSMDKRFTQTDKRFEQMHQDIMGLHQEIKLLMRWSLATSLAIGGLILAVLKMVS